MKKNALFFLIAVVLGCSSALSSQNPVHQRGWIGGQFKRVTVFPAWFSHPPKAAVLITALNTNTPAGLAGLSEGDLILEVNHQPATSVKALRHIIDPTEPGKLPAVKTWHDGEIAEHNVRVGRETFSQSAIFALGIPGFFHTIKLVPSRRAGFSLGLAGFKPEPVSDRKELTSAEEMYFKSCNPKHYQPVEEGWKAWLVIMQAETNKRIKSQDVVGPETGALGGTSDQQAFGYVQ